MAGRIFRIYIGICGIDNKKPQSIIDALEVIVAAFECCCYNIDEVVTDSEACFIAVSPHLRSLMHSRHVLTPPKQHNQRIERYVRTINDRMRSVLAGLAYILPVKLYGELMATVVYFMNVFPNKVHPTLTPAIVFHGDKMDCRQVNHVPFGSAVMVKETDRSSVDNKYAPRAELALVLGPSPLVRSGVHVYVRSTRMIKTRNRYVIVPMVPSDFGFESKPGTVVSSIPDFLTYDPSLRSQPSPTDYDEEAVPSTGARGDAARLAAQTRSMEAYRIRNSFRNGRAPLGLDHMITYGTEQLPPISPGFPHYTSKDVEEVDDECTYMPTINPSTATSETSSITEATRQEHVRLPSHDPAQGSTEPPSVTGATGQEHVRLPSHDPAQGSTEPPSVTGATAGEQFEVLPSHPRTGRSKPPSVTGATRREHVRLPSHEPSDITGATAGKQFEVLPSLPGTGRSKPPSVTGATRREHVRLPGHEPSDITGATAGGQFKASPSPPSTGGLELPSVTGTAHYGYDNIPYQGRRTRSSRVPRVTVISDDEPSDCSTGMSSTRTSRRSHMMEETSEAYGGQGRLKRSRRGSPRS